jgi:hypothetical protein
MVLLLIVSAKRSEQHASNGRDEGGSSNVVSTLTVIPELIDEVAQFLRVLTSTRSRRKPGAGATRCGTTERTG